MWTKALYDLGLISFEEPYKKLLNQGMIQGSSRFVYRLDFTDAKLLTPNPIFISAGIISKFLNKDLNADLTRQLFDVVRPLTTKYVDWSHIKTDFRINSLHVDVNMVNGVELDVEAFQTVEA